MPSTAGAQEDEFVVLSGRVYTADGRAPAGLRFFVRTAERTDSVPVRSDGGFTVVMRRPAQDSVVLFIDAAARPERWYYPSLARMAVIAAERDSLRFVLIPKVWVIERGTYVGTAAEVSVSAAFQEFGEPESSSFYRSWNAPRRARHRTTAVSWPAESFPIPVVFIRRPGERPITKSDSTRFWNAAGQLEKELGRDLFQPGSAATLAGDTIEPHGVITAYRGRGIGAAGRGGVRYRAGGDVYHGSVIFRDGDVLEEPRLAKHELLHALGFGHTCSWFSIMSVPECKVGGRRVSPHDVAHIELLFSAEALRRRHGAEFGITAALDGVRELMAGGALAEAR